MGAPPRVLIGRVDDYQEALVSFTRNDHLAACGKPLIANFKLAR